MKTGFQSWILGKGLYIVPMLFAFSPLVTGSWPERFEVFGFAMIGLVAFTTTIENFWDHKLSLWERLLFGMSAVLLLSQDSLLGLDGHFDLVPDVHIVGLILFIATMFIHKRITGKGEVVPLTNHTIQGQ